MASLGLSVTRVKNSKKVLFMEKRSFCPSCCAKRQAEAATHLTENILPIAPYRQFVVSFPIPMRYWLNSNKKLFSKVESIITKVIHKHYIDAAKELGIKGPLPGSISFTQRWGSACNLNPESAYSLFRRRVLRGRRGRVEGRQV
jgi:Transposase zinc-binding domain